jgi:hypothetical protein
MRLLRNATIALVVCLLAVAAHAQIPTSGNVFFGYSYLRASSAGTSSNFNGWDGSLEGKIFPFVGIVADLSGEYGSQSGVNIHEYNFLFGPRVSFSVGRFRPFAHALFGAAHTSGSASDFSSSDTSFGDALGGGIDYRLWHIAGWRFQIDDVQTRFSGGTQNNFRFATGLVIHF